MHSRISHAQVNKQWQLVSMLQACAPVSAADLWKSCRHLSHDREIWPVANLVLRHGGDLSPIAVTSVPVSGIARNITSTCTALCKQHNGHWKEPDAWLRCVAGPSPLLGHASQASLIEH